MTGPMFVVLLALAAVFAVLALVFVDYRRFIRYIAEPADGEPVVIDQSGRLIETETAEVCMVGRHRAGRRWGR